MSDHFSGPAVIGDPAADITDFFAFRSPEREDALVLVMNLFPLASSEARFSDVLTNRFRLRPLEVAGRAFVAGSDEFAIDVRFSDIPDDGGAQTGSLVASDGRTAEFRVGEPFERDGLRIFAGLASDPFFMDVEAAIRTDVSGLLSFDTAANTVQFRDILALVVEVPLHSIAAALGHSALIAAMCENFVTRPGKMLRIERVGRPEIKNVLMANSARDPRSRGVELRDLYNREDSFALSDVYRPLYEGRLDANLAFWDGLDNDVAWPVASDGRHPLRDVLIQDVLVLDVTRPFAPGGFLEIERALCEGRPHQSCGGRWLDDDIFDELLTWIVNGGRGERQSDGVSAPTKPASRVFPYVREPNLRADLPLPAFLGG